MPRRNNKNKKKKQSNSGLGRAIKNKWGGKPDIENKASGRVKRKDHIIESQFTSNPSHQNRNKLKSITEVNNIQEFVDTMRVEQEISNERLENEELKLIEIDPTETIESSEIKYHQKLNESELFNYENLPIPRKPKWDSNTTSEELNIASRRVFLNWRRGLSNTAQQTNMEMTPYEKNINIWKQLWNVVERSNLLILIVDARNPLAFISRDLFKYVYQVDKKKRCILMINKADYLTPLQRQYWRKYFDSQNIQILYFSAMREQIRFDLMTKSHRDKISEIETEKIINNIDENVLRVEDLVNIFLEIKKQIKLKNKKIEIGFIGYPNVGKSSVINVLMRKKKVSVGSTPGKTKHFQTLILSNEIILCDCPGLVFPTLMSSKDDMILNGVIPIDHLNNFIKPSRLMIHRIKIKQLNTFYKLKLPTNKKKIKFLTVYDILDSYCHQKKLYTKSKVPNRNEAARVMLKDYVKGKIIYCHFPPNLNSRNKYLFYNGKILNNNNNNNNNNNQQNNQKIENVLDMNKLNGDNNNDELYDDNNNNNNNELYDKITDEEFLQVWKHPLDGYGGLLGTSKKKHQKKARVIRRMEKRQQKQNRGYRHDIDNFKHGSNAIVVSSVPNISVKHKPVVL